MIILIADDDRLIRFTMKSMLHDILPAEASYLEAADGLSLVELCRKHTPDIAFVDIKMPFMDGITAIEQCRMHSPDTEFVIISGYSDFEYAKRCIPLQITEYLLKPVDEEQLGRIISLLQEKLAHRKHRSNSDFHLSLLNAFNYLSTVRDAADFEEPSLPLGNVYYLFGIFTWTEKKNPGCYPDSHQKLIHSINQLGQELIQSGFGFCQIYSNEGTPYYIIHAPGTAAVEHQILDSMNRLSRIHRDNQVNRCIIYSKETTFLTLFARSDYLDEHACLCMNHRNNAFLPFHSLPAAEPQIHVLHLVQILLSAFNRAEESLYKDTINTLYRLYKDNSLDLNLPHIAAFAERTIGYPINSASFKAFCRSFIDLAGQMYTQIEQTDLSLVEQIKAYIRKNYMNDISISQIAELYHLTPNYLGSLFHQQEGCKLIDYITQTRLSNAKRILLENRTASVKNVAVMVGYNSSRHFAMTFQKAVGVTPSGYRKLQT